MSMYSNHSAPLRPSNQPSAQLSTTTLLNALHTCYTSGQPFSLEASTSIAVNTWVTALNGASDGRHGGTVDEELGRRAWEHARRRAEDGCIVLGSVHESAPSLLLPFVASLPVSAPASFYTAFNALRPFLFAVTPRNPSLPRYSSLAATLTLSLNGDLTGASFSLSTFGLDIKNGLLNLPAKPGYRAFDVFYYLLASATATEREYLELKDPSQYSLLRKTETYAAPSYLPTADDVAAAEDFRESLKAIGIKGASLRNLLSVIAAVLKLGDALGFLVDEDVLVSTCEEVSGLLEVDEEVLLRKCDTTEREVLIGAIYEATVDWVISKANEAIRNEMRTGRMLGSSSGSDTGNSGMDTPPSSQDDGDHVSITIVEIPAQSLGKAIALRTVFDDTAGINAEMKEDGVPVSAAGSSVMREMNAAVSENEPRLGITTGLSARDHEAALDRREGVLEKVGSETEEGSFLRRILYPVDGQGILLGKNGRFDLSTLLASSRVWFQLSLHPTDESPASLANQSHTTHPWSAGAVSSQIRSWRLPEWANHRNKQLDYTADFDVQEFVERYSRLGCHPNRDGVETWIMERGWSNGEVIIGTERVWIREAAWWEAESMLDLKPVDETPGMFPLESGYSVTTPNVEGLYGPFGDQNTISRENLLPRSHSMANQSQFGTRSMAPTQARSIQTQNPGDYGLGGRGDDKKNQITYYDDVDPEIGVAKAIKEVPITFSRRAWIVFVWAVTFWIPSFMLRYVGRMKRPDVRQAWREKLVLVLLIFLLNATVVFYIVEFGKLLCPNYDKAWNSKEVSEHQGDDDFYVSFRGGVYDLSKFWRLQHSDSTTQTTSTNMQPFAGTDVSEYIVPPLNIACPGLVDTDTIQLQPNTTLLYSSAQHVSGSLARDPRVSCPTSIGTLSGSYPR